MKTLLNKIKMDLKIFFNNYKRIIIEFCIIILVAIFCYLFYKYQIASAKKEALKEQSLINSYKDSTGYFKTEVDKLGIQYNEQKQETVELNKDNEDLLKQNSKLKQVLQQTKFITKTTINNKNANYTNNKKAIDSLHCVPIGTQFKSEDEWYSLIGEVDTNSIKIKELNVNEKFDINTGIGKNPGIFGFLKSKNHVIEIVSKNPYSKVTSMKNLTIQENIKWYQKGILKFGAGFTTAIILIAILP